MNREAIQERIENVLKDVNLFENYDKISLDTKLDTVFNSITFIKFLVSLEQEFEIEFDDDDLAFVNIADFNDIVDRICEISSNK